MTNPNATQYEPRHEYDEACRDCRNNWAHTESDHDEAVRLEAEELRIEAEAEAEAKDQRVKDRLLWLIAELDNIGYDNTDLLPVLLKFLRDREDADGDSEGYHPNQEMSILGAFERQFGKESRS